MNLQYWQKLWNVCYLIFIHNLVPFFDKSATNKKTGNIFVVLPSMNISTSDNKYS